MLKVIGIAVLTIYAATAVAAPAAHARDTGGHEHDLTPAQVLAGAADLLKNRQPEQAIGLLEFGLAEFPLDVEMNLLYLELLLENRIEELARGSYEARLKEYGDEPILLVGLGRLAADDAGARASYERALAVDQDFAPARLGLAELALKNRDLDGAAAAIDAAWAANPDDRRVYAFRGTLRMELGQFEDAVDDFNRALQGDPYAPAVHARLGQAYYLLENYEAAAEEYRDAIALNGDGGAYYLGLGRALEATNDTAAARLNYRTAASKTADDKATPVAALKAAGRLAYLSGETAEAKQELERAVALAPEDAEAWGFLGINRMMTDDAAAAAAFANAAELEPSRADWWFYLGVCRQRTGEYDGAEEALLKAHEAITTYKRADDKVTDENIMSVLAAVRAMRAAQRK